jgi:hypothetical protein
MEGVAPFRFVPAYQPHEGREVAFTLKPLDLKNQYSLQASMDEQMVPSWSGIELAAKHIVGWSGLQIEDGAELPFSRSRVQQIVSGGADLNWMIWLGQIAGKLYVAAMLPEIERKN